MVATRLAKKCRENSESRYLETKNDQRRSEMKPTVSKMSGRHPNN